MSIELAYWIILLIWAVFGFMPQTGQPARTWRDFSGVGVMLVLFILIGCTIYGQPLHK